MGNSFQDKVRARLHRGFANWNQGYDSWLEWCETLYEPDAHYNVYGQRGFPALSPRSGIDPGACASSPAWMAKAKPS